LSLGFVLMKKAPVNGVFVGFHVAQ
jgi:hypothetical protein